MNKSLPPPLSTKNYQPVLCEPSQNPTLIIDNGSSNSRVGFSFEDLPGSVFPTVFGRVGGRPIYIGPGIAREGYVGHEALSKRGIASLKYPIKRGIVTNWEFMEKIWSHNLILEMNIAMEEHCVLLTETPLNPTANREKMCQLMFERFRVPAMCVAVQAVLSLFASGRSSGIVLDSGGGVSNVVPVYEGLALPHAISRQELAGSDVTDHLMTLLMARGYGFMPAERDIVNDIKEKMCFVALDCDSEKKLFESSTPTADSSYELPDGNVINLGCERFICPELLFQPNMVEMEEIGLHESIHNSIRKCDLDIRKQLYSNILLAGGSTQIKGFSERLFKELKEITSSSVEFNIVTPPDRNNSSWIGGRILSSMSTFGSMCMSKAEYEEIGPGIVHKKCF